MQQHPLPEGSLHPSCILTSKLPRVEDAKERRVLREKERSRVGRCRFAEIAEASRQKETQDTTARPVPAHCSGSGEGAMRRDFLLVKADADLQLVVFHGEAGQQRSILQLESKRQSSRRSRLFPELPRDRGRRLSSGLKQRLSAHPPLRTPRGDEASVPKIIVC